MANEIKYNPSDFKEFYGKTFETMHSAYKLVNGRILGRASIEGANIDMLAGINANQEYIAKIALVSKEALDLIINEIGQKPAEGLLLVLSLKGEDTLITKRNGMVTSMIQKIY